MKNLIAFLFVVLIVYGNYSIAQVTPYTGGEGSGTASSRTNLLTCVMYFGGGEDGAAQNSAPTVICPWYFGSEGDGYDGDSAGLCRMLLPVRLLLFNGIKEETRNLLFWQTETPEQVRFYNVERSGNGIHYRTIGTVTAGNTTRLYSFYDYSPLAGTNYYRLQIKERNGEESHSHIVVLKDHSPAAIQAYPNPAKNDLWVYYHSREQIVTPLTITSLNGKQVYRQPVLLRKGGNLFTINLRPLASGLYLVRLGQTGTPVKLIVSR